MTSGAAGITKKVAELWQEAVDQDLANSSDLSFEAFLGAQYSLAHLAGQCTITEEGMEIVESALNELQELIDGVEEEDEEDEDE